ncbi:MAG: hypothetical protein HY925_10820 [Elusimicrobia bacterium]|nr:hypothetical protein [Elusimicrobiota bacterium]
MFIRSLAVLVLCAAPALAQELSFDSGVDAKAVLDNLHRHPGDGIPMPRYTNSYYRWSTRECTTLSLPPGGPAKTEEVWLSSTDFEHDCYYRGDPRYGGGRDCYDRPAGTHRERVQIESRGNRSTNPWERETFQACLEGRWLDVRGLQTAYRYDIKEDPMQWGHFLATAGSKQKMDPDASGITAALVNSAGGFAVDFQDKWASYYAGETVKLHLELWKDVEGWFDSKAADLDLEVSAGPVWRAGFSGVQGLQSGKKYYVKWTFRRIGGVSKDSEMKGNQPEAVFQPSLSAAGR